ncbi:STAS domain-containing protein [Enorma massiliensis]|uniref:Anti-sigma factor antagonist n=1 Tax=Enorma massiliensis TaxID=1472761 RepID=A0A1Y3U482_9ACTN|nr:STAS domain-containing protein [Enorma massiliensis]OUN41219.1 anti-anti-sigma factor [Enorma massiliensis]
MDLTITTNASPERYTIGVTGEVDISNASKLRDAIDLALEQPTEAIQLDFEHVAYIDSTGVGVLVGAAHHAAERDRGFSVVNAQPGVMRVAQLLGVDAEISITAL